MNEILPLDLSEREQRNARNICGCLSVRKSTLFLDILIVRRWWCVVGWEWKCIDVFRNQRAEHFFPLARLEIRRLEVEYEIENKLTERFIFGSIKTLQTMKNFYCISINRKESRWRESGPVSEFIIVITEVYILFCRAINRFQQQQPSFLLLA